MLKNRHSIVVLVIQSGDADSARIVGASALVPTAGPAVAVAFRRAAHVFDAVAGVRDHTGHAQRLNDQQRIQSGYNGYNPSHAGHSISAALMGQHCCVTAP